MTSKTDTHSAQPFWAAIVLIEAFLLAHTIAPVDLIAGREADRRFFSTPCHRNQLHSHLRSFVTPLLEHAPLLLHLAQVDINSSVLHQQEPLHHTLLVALSNSSSRPHHRTSSSRCRELPLREQEEGTPCSPSAPSCSRPCSSNSSSSNLNTHRDRGIVCGEFLVICSI